MSTQTMIKGIAAVIYFPLPRRATSATVTILQKTGEAIGLPVASQACQDAPPDLDTTLNGAVESGATDIVLTVGSSALEGARVLLEGTDDNNSEWIEGKVWTDATKTLSLWNPLSRAHITGVKVQTTTVTYNLTAAHQDQQYDRNICYVLATIDTVVHRFTYVYSVKLAKFRNPVTELDILRYMPSSSQHDWEETQGWKKQILAGEAEVRAQMLGMDIDLDDILNPEDASLAIIWGTMWVILQAQAMVAPDREDARDYTEAKFKDQCLLLGKNAAWIEDGPQDLVMDDEEDKGDHDMSAVLS